MSSLTDYITGLISYLGYGAIFVLMTIESVGIPIPSELIMPFGGYLASTGQINWVLAAVAGTLGTGLGSAIGYAIGAWGGKPLVDRYGKYIDATPEKIAKAEKWFGKYGESAVFYTRLMPVVRSMVNVPAGMLNMNFLKFMAYTLAGAFPWCLVLSFIGYTLGENWDKIGQYTHLLDNAMVVVAAAIVIGAVGLYVLVRRGIVKKETVKKYLGFLP
jgi:membrane protein DedA with SNARE-associated domain